MLYRYPEERNSGDGFYTCQECDTASLYTSVKEKWKHVSVIQKGFQEKNTNGFEKLFRQTAMAGGREVRR